MINGNPNRFIDMIYTCQDIVFVYDKIKYWFQGYMIDDKVHMEVFQYEPASERYVWEYNGPTCSEGQAAFQKAPFFNGKTFWQVEKDIEWVDC
jgi:hypothetical protein